MHCNLDFTSEVIALSRNIGAPQSVHFKVRPDGSVTGLYFSGSEFKNLAPYFLENYQLPELRELPFSFYFPKAWQVAERKNAYQFFKKGDAPISAICGMMAEEEMDLGEVLSRQFPDHHLIYKGREQTEIRGRYLWREKSFSTVTAGEAFQHLVLLNETKEGAFYLVLSVPSDLLTREVQTVLSVLMESFEVR